MDEAGARRTVPALLALAGVVAAGGLSGWLVTGSTHHRPPPAPAQVSAPAAVVAYPGAAPAADPQVHGGPPGRPGHVLWLFIGGRWRAVPG